MAVTVSHKSLCGWCNDGNHASCGIGVKYSGKLPHKEFPEGIVWACRCREGGCTPDRRKCAQCGNTTTEEIDPNTWECLDQEACRALVETRRETSPFLAQLREIEEKVKMAKIENDKTKAESKAAVKVPVPCTCGCGDNTKGGKFLPGHDARYVSERVTLIVNGNFADKVEKAQRARIAKDNVSDALQAKFEKSLGLAREKADKKAAAAQAKADAKAEKASANA